MDRCRQQNARNQRMRGRNYYQQNVEYYPESRMGVDCDRSCNSCMNDMMPMEDCPGEGMDPVGRMPLAMAYVPWQRFGNLYDECEALYHGTIFMDLDLGFYGKRCE